MEKEIEVTLPSYDDFKFPEGYCYSDVIEQVESEYNASIDFVNDKRELFRSRDDLYMNISNQQDKVYVRLVFSTIQTLKALSASNDISVKFRGRRLGTEVIAKNKQNLAKFDYEEMRLAEKKDAGRDDLFKYGVMIEGGDGWDSNRKCPKTIIIDPRTWIPDVYADVNSGFSYHGFELLMRSHDFKSGAGYFNSEYALSNEEVHEYLEKLSASESKDKTLDRQSLNSVRLLNGTLSSPDRLGNYSIYRHYTILGGRKYCTEWANDRTLLIRFYEIKPVSKAEKKDPSLVERPIVVRNWIEQPGDPFGISIPDILEDKQRMMQLFLNLNKIKAEYEARGDIFFYDPNVVKNIDTLKIPPKGGPRYVKADLSKGTPMLEAPKAGIKNDAMNMPGVLQNQGMLDIGIDSRTMGVTPEGVISATENQRVQNNANLRMLLGIKLYNRAEKKFWKILRDRVYQQYFRLTDSKNIYINTTLGSKPIVVNQKDIGTYEDIDIYITSKIEEEEENTKKLRNILPIANFVLTRPGSKYGKDDILRKIYTWSGATEEESLSWIDPSIEEVKAKADVELINENEAPLECTDLNEDHRTYIVIYQSAIDTPAKQEAINTRMALYVQSGQAKQAGDMMKQLGNSDNLSNTQQQLVSSSLNQQGDASKSAASLQGMM